MAVKAEAEILFKASHRYARISARKARLVMDLIRGQNAENALVRLEYCERRASPMIRKVLESAIANAAQMSGVESANLVVNEAYADEGPTMKRWRPRSMGRAYPRLKRSCHLSVALAAVEGDAGVAKIGTEETITEEAVTEEVVAEEAAVEEMAVDEVAVDEDGAEENSADEAGEDEAVVEDSAAAEEVAGEEADGGEDDASAEEEPAEEDAEAGADEESNGAEDDSEEDAVAGEDDGES